MGRGSRATAEAERWRGEGRNDPRARGRTHSGISPLALPISRVLHWRGRSLQPSRKRYRINVSLITYTAPARAPHPSPLFPRFSRSLFPFTIFSPPLLSWRYDTLKKQTFIRTKKKRQLHADDVPLLREHAPPITSVPVKGDYSREWSDRKMPNRDVISPNLPWNPVSPAR